jgi:hypothetical protein
MRNRRRKKNYGKTLEKKRKRFRKSYFCYYLNVWGIRKSYVTSFTLRGNFGVRKWRRRSLNLKL